ncbi:unnamed protein product [Musa acuminata subsp. malaccensis]|uniref:(wild Malaysian banana) hypothetical protein n=1 Tax=Musa acuminata subsp. malaccensis TaxID=214687 RepID=A0A804L2X9_MUSAM|nr:unnamed protein product [Musa acuminata subsp. malaccensis]
MSWSTPTNADKFNSKSNPPVAPASRTGSPLAPQAEEGHESLRRTFRRREVSASVLASRHGNQHEDVNTGEAGDSAPGWLASPTSATKRTPGWPRVYAAASR